MTDAIHLVEVPRESANDDTVILAGWAVEDGARVSAGDKVCDIETSKAMVEVEAPADGWLFHLHAEGAEVPVGDPIGQVAPTDQRPGAGDAKQSAAATPTAVGGTGPSISRKARALMEAHGIGEDEFADQALVRERDVRAVMEARARQAGSGAGGEAAMRVEALTPLQKRTAKVLTESYTTIPHSYLSRFLDAALAQDRLDALCAKHDIAASLSDLLVYAVAAAAPDFPKANASWTEQGLGYHEAVNIGFALNLSNGDLVVPVIRDANTLDFDAVVAAIRDYQKKALRHRLEADHLSGGTLSVTSLVGSGVQQVLPLIVPGQTTIMALGDRIDAGTLAGTHCLTLAYDHRVVNGTEAGAFLKRVSDIIEGRDAD